MKKLTPAVLSSVSIVSAAAFVNIARQVAGRQTASTDGRVREQLQEQRGVAGDAAARATNPLGKEWFHLPVAMALSSYLLWRERRSAALIPVAASLTAEVASRVLDRLPPHRRPPSGHPKPYKPS